MHFIEFIRSVPDGQDKKVQAFINLAKADKDFPMTSDPSKLAIYLYQKLNPETTHGFQVCMMIYSKERKNKLPKMCFGRDDMMLHAINVIVGLQNFDSDYKWNK
jgi:hypothetical protein